MEDICSNCNIDYKLTYCCHSNPETKETKVVFLRDSIRTVCPDFGIDGKCKDHVNRPEDCREYECPRFSHVDLHDYFVKNRKTSVHSKYDEGFGFVPELGQGLNF
jgi:hypothetical protein